LEQMLAIDEKCGQQELDDLLCEISQHMVCTF